MSVLELVSLPFCQALQLDAWDSPPRRYFAAYRTQGNFRWLLGHPVVDEFGTISSPIFLAPHELLGKIYNAGISLGHQRDPEMGIDLGWPPFCIGLSSPAPELPVDWEDRLLAALKGSLAAESVGPARPALDTLEASGFVIQRLAVGGATVLATSAPLLPRQLRRLCETEPGPVTVAVASGNRLIRSAIGVPQAMHALSEARLEELLQVARRFAA